MKTARLAASLLALLALAPLAAQEAASALKRGPVVSVDGNATTVDIVTDASMQDAKLVATVEGKVKVTTFEPAGKNELRARIELPPATSVSYDVIASSGSLAHGVLHTLPERGTKKLTFCAVGDTGWPRRGDGEATDDQLAVARLIEQQEPDLVIHTGDIIYLVGQPKSFDALFFRPYTSTLSRVPMFCALGNHDVKTRNGSYTLEQFPYPRNQNSNRYYSFDAANVHFACIDSNEIIDADDPGAFATTPQGKWLVSDLASATAAWKVVFCHHPLYSATKMHKLDTEAMRHGCEKLLLDAGVDVVVTGHTHYYHRSVRLKDGEPDDAGIVYVVTGGGGAPLYTGEPKPKVFTACYASRYHMTRFDVDGLSLHVRAIGLDAQGKSEVFDDAVIANKKVR